MDQQNNIEYRRLTLDYFLQNLLLQKQFITLTFVSFFFRINTNAPNSIKIKTTDSIKECIKVVLLNKQRMEVDIGRNTEALEVWTQLWDQLKINYVKDKRLFLFQNQRIVKVFENNESVLSVLERFKSKNKIAKIATTKIQHESTENTNMGKYLNLSGTSEMHLVFMKWYYFPYDFSIKEDDESIDSLNFRAIQTIADFQTKCFKISTEETWKFVGMWWSLNHEEALKIWEISIENSEIDVIIKLITENTKILNVSKLLAPNLKNATEEDMSIIK